MTDGSCYPSVTVLVLMKAIGNQRFITLDDPTGIGKTRLAKQFGARYVWNQGRSIVWICLNDDRTAVSKLIGTTAGYVGYDDNSNTLTERVRRNPYIILLDEIEKFDPNRPSPPSLG